MIVATVRAMKLHGGVPLKNVAEPNLAALKQGFEQLGKHLETAAFYGLPVVVSDDPLSAVANGTGAVLNDLSWLMQNV